MKFQGLSQPIDLVLLHDRFARYDATPDSEAMQFIFDLGPLEEKFRAALEAMSLPYMQDGQYGCMVNDGATFADVYGPDMAALDAVRDIGSAVGEAVLGARPRTLRRTRVFPNSPADINRGLTIGAYVHIDQETEINETGVDVVGVTSGPGTIQYLMLRAEAVKPWPLETAVPNAERLYGDNLRAAARDVAGLFLETKEGCVRVVRIKPGHLYALVPNINHRTGNASRCVPGRKAILHIERAPR